jgi:mRNA-degrading endonuclease RelE of RelBE toxin-antitoxin system
MALPSDLPGNVLLVSSASKDLARIFKRNRQEFFRIWDDLKRLGLGSLPPQGKKKLHSVDAFQIDSGRYRIIYSRRDSSYVIWAVLAKPEQRDFFRRLRS